jgi:hypothetical protein
LLCALCAGLVVAPAAGLAKTNYVSSGGDNSDGLTWATAEWSIASAVSQSVAADVVLASNGTYAIAVETPTTNAVSVVGLAGWMEHTLPLTRLCSPTRWRRQDPSQ